MQLWILQKVSTEDLFCQNLHKRVSNIQLFPSQPHHVSPWSLMLFWCHNSHFLLTWVPSAGGTSEARDCKKNVFVCLLNCGEQRLTLCSKLHVNGCICNLHTVICTILSQISDTKRFFFLLLFYRLFCTSLPQERGSSQRVCVKVLAGVWERQ